MKKTKNVRDRFVDGTKAFFKVLVLFNKLGAETFMRIYLMGAQEELNHLKDRHCNCNYCQSMQKLLKDGDANV